MNGRLVGRKLARASVGLALVIAGTTAVDVEAGAATAPVWSVVATAAGAAYGRLDGVSCPTPSICVAVGTQDSSNRMTKLIERWNGTRWVAQLSPTPAGAVSSHLSAVRCASRASCLAVGQYSTSTTTRTLALRWDGSHWSIVRSANPPDAAVSGLTDLACPSSTSCFAVGGWFAGTPTSSAESTLVERWNGSAWSIVPSPNVSDAIDSGLSGVACATATSCFAVGSSYTEVRNDTLVEHWDGTSWSIEPSPDPGSSSDNELSSVACPLATGCIAVGSASGRGTLVERRDGTSWSIVRSPNPTGSTAAALTGISCPSVARCFAVGVTFATTSEQRLVELFTPKGSSIVRVPVPSGTVRSSLGGVSCAGVNNCFAVGEYRKGPSRRPLLLRYGSPTS